MVKEGQSRRNESMQTSSLIHETSLDYRLGDLIAVFPELRWLKFQDGETQSQ